MIKPSSRLNGPIMTESDDYNINGIKTVGVSPITTRSIAWKEIRANSQSYSNIAAKQTPASTAKQVGTMSIKQKQEMFSKLMNFDMSRQMQEIQSKIHKINHPRKPKTARHVTFLEDD